MLEKEQGASNNVISSAPFHTGPFLACNSRTLSKTVALDKSVTQLAVKIIACRAAGGGFYQVPVYLHLTAVSEARVLFYLVSSAEYWMFAGSCVHFHNMWQVLIVIVAMIFWSDVSYLYGPSLGFDALNLNMRRQAQCTMNYKDLFSIVHLGYEILTRQNAQNAQNAQLEQLIAERPKRRKYILPFTPMNVTQTRRLPTKMRLNLNIASDLIVILYEFVSKQCRIKVTFNMRTKVIYSRVCEHRTKEVHLIQCVLLLEIPAVKILKQIYYCKGG